MSCLNPSLLRDSLVPVREIFQRKLPVAERTFATLSQPPGTVLTMLAVLLSSPVLALPRMMAFLETVDANDEPVLMNDLIGYSVPG